MGGERWSSPSTNHRVFTINEQNLPAPPCPWGAPVVCMFWGQSRRHWLSARVYKRQLLLGYMVFNAALYGGQLILYSMLFLPSFNKASGKVSCGCEY